MTRGPSATDTLHVSATAVTAVATADNGGWSLYGASVANPRTGAELARAEDEIDAYICAYIAFYYWTHGTTRCRVAGDVTDGYILTPVTPELAACLDRVTCEPVDERPERVVARRGLTLVERNAARVEALLVGAAVDVTPHVAEVGDEFQSSEPSEEVPNPNDEHPEEER